jgi:hypothetical protein
VLLLLCCAVLYCVVEHDLYSYQKTAPDEYDGYRLLLEGPFRFQISPSSFHSHAFERRLSTAPLVSCHICENRRGLRQDQSCERHRSRAHAK